MDRGLMELRMILGNYDELARRGRLGGFGCLGRDVDLCVVLMDGVADEDKKNVIRKRIRVMEEKREIMRPMLLSEDRNFYYHSLNQKLHDEISELEVVLSY